MIKQLNNQLQGLDSELTEAIIDTLREPIIILDSDLRVAAASRSFYETFHVNYTDIEGTLFYDLGNGEWNIPSLRTLLEQVIPQKTIVEGYEVEHVFEGLGSRIMLINARQIVFTNNRRNIFLSISDVTDFRNTQREKEQLMTQKDTLLREMRHRIANSLQLIASIILLKAHSVKSDESRLQLQDAHDRILSIATVQRNLDPTEEGSMISVVPYLTTLCESVAKSMIGGRKPITLVVSGGTGTVSPDEAIALGLITTELVMNSLKHAFPTGKGAITVVFESHDKEWTLRVSDDGIGYSNSDRAIDGGLGTSIIDSLASQIHASVKRQSSPQGTMVFISYPSSTEAHSA